MAYGVKREQVVVVRENGEKETVPAPKTINGLRGIALNNKKFGKDLNGNDLPDRKQD